MQKIEIVRGWFRTAGSHFGWRGYEVKGVGINLAFLRNCTDPEIMISIDSREYILNVQKALAFIKEHKSTYMAGSTRLGVVSRSLLIPMDKKEIIEPPEETQSLFDKK